jgi:hypothetical protein
MKTGIREKEDTKRNALYSKGRNMIQIYTVGIRPKPKKVDRAKRMYRFMKYTTQDIV